MDDTVARQRLEKFVAAGIRVFIDLTRPDDRNGKGLRPYNPVLQRLAIDKGLQLTYISSPIRDQSAPTETQMSEILTLINLFTMQQKPVYVHCWGGIGRTGTVVSCYLIEKKSLTARQAIDKMNLLRKDTPDARQTSPQDPTQIALIDRWAIRNQSPNQPDATPVLFYSKDKPYYNFTNFAPYGFELDGYYWQTSEHYFQAQKFVGTPYFDKVREANSPREAFDLAHKFDAHKCAGWLQLRDGVMKKAVYRKFETNADIQAELLGTGNRLLVEDSKDKDEYWGNGADGKGKNMLGTILMEVREELRR